MRGPCAACSAAQKTRNKNALIVTSVHNRIFHRTRFQRRPYFCSWNVIVDSAETEGNGIADRKPDPLRPVRNPRVSSPYVCSGNQCLPSTGLRKVVNRGNRFSDLVSRICGTACPSLFTIEHHSCSPKQTVERLCPARIWRGRTCKTQQSISPTFSSRENEFVDPNLVRGEEHRLHFRRSRKSSSVRTRRFKARKGLPMIVSVRSI